MHAVLDISRLDSQRIEFHRKPVYLGDLFRRLAIEYAPMAEVKGLALTFVPTSAVVDSDPVFLRRIAQNLVSNAIKYTESGRVLVGIRRQGDQVWLEIHDTGIGIPPADRSRIFDEFQRVGREGVAPGMGLGLSIVRRACAKLGHPITVDSEQGRGTVFRVGLPIVAPDEDGLIRIVDKTPQPCADGWRWWWKTTPTCAAPMN
ncbi:sensor histidine kinase [Paracoccus cavernae]|uniref:sensor histidine kinase n=1 Tax=Paracoccus cavernae TaxID=1571207 RepID=UPI00363758B3